MARRSLICLAFLLLAASCGEQPPRRPTGRFLLSWTFVSGRTCGDDRFRITYVPIGTDEPPVEEELPCLGPDGEPGARGTPVPVGSYRVEIQLLNTGGNPVPGIEAGTTNGTILTEGSEVELALAVPDRPDAFDVVFHVDLGEPGGLQCVPPGSGGLGATRQDLRLILISSDECVSVPLGGQDQAGSEIVSSSCSTDGLRCIEATGTQRLEGVPPGRYRLEIDASQGGAVCWSGQAIFDTSDFRRREETLVDPVAGGPLRLPSTGACD